jgi:oligopeptide transport system substrate-binding protein
MRPENRSKRCIPSLRGLSLLGLVCAALTLAACSEFGPGNASSYFADTPPPPAGHLRWSNGRSPKTVDPARAAAAPEADIARAIFEGLTDIDPATLEAIPAAAESWETNGDSTIWTFRLREGLKWSNGAEVTADDFARSWKRAADLVPRAPHRALLETIAGVERTSGVATMPGQTTNGDTGALSKLGFQPGVQSSIAAIAFRAEPVAEPLTVEPDAAPVFGAVARDARTLVVTLNRPDPEFPKLVAHAIFRPVPPGGEGLSPESITAATVTNGPFVISEASAEMVRLTRSDTYWGRESVQLERVDMIAAETIESALDAYRAGRIDVITNAEFSPVLLKLLLPYDDFRRTQFAALNFYEVNATRRPFNDRRVREALAIAIERERLAEGELEGSTTPAFSIFPFGSAAASNLLQDKMRARELMRNAGFENGQGFPAVRLIVNRNDTQQRIARSIAAMWKESLNIETEIVVLESAEVEQARAAGEFDLIRRGMVLQTPDTHYNLGAIFGPRFRSPLVPEPSPSPTPTPANGGSNTATQATPTPAPAVISTEEDALYELTAIPLYFPTSYSLVRPYVSGFAPNSFDIQLLQRVSIEQGYSPAGAIGPDRTDK